MIEVIIGTSRPGANSRKIGNIVFELYRAQGIEVDLIDLKDISVEAFTGEAINERPKAIAQYAERILKAKGVHIVTPEYNAGIPGVFKCFIDLLPIPEVTQNKCFAITTVSSGNFGGIRSLQQLQIMLLYKEGIVFNETVMFPKADSLFNEQGQLISEKDLSKLEKQTKGFVNFVGRFKD